MNPASVTENFFFDDVHVDKKFCDKIYFIAHDMLACDTRNQHLSTDTVPCLMQESSS